MESLTLSNQSKNTRSCSQQTPRTMPPPSSAVSPETSAKNDVVTDGPGPPSTNKNEEGTPTPTLPTTPIPSIAAPRSREVCVAASSSSRRNNTTDSRSSPSPPAPSSISRPKIPRAAKTMTRKTAPINVRSNPLTGGVVVSADIAAEVNKGHQCRRSRARSTSNNNSNTRSNSDKKTPKNSKPKSKTATKQYNDEPPQDQQQQLQDQTDQQPVPGGAHNHQVVKTELRGVRTAAAAAAEWCAADSSASSSSCSYSSCFFGDIVCGFSGGLPRHGYLPNFKFRRLLQYLRDVYDDLPSSGGNVAAAAAANGNTSGKKVVCTMILEFIWEHGGRFLRHNVASDCWEPLSYSKCFAKVSQTFRDLRSCRFDHNSSAGRNNRSSRGKGRKKNSRGGAQQQPPPPHNGAGAGAGAGAASMCTLTRGDIVEWELLRAQIRKRLRLPRECADVVARRTLQILATATMTTTLAGAPPPPPPPSAPSTSAAAAAAATQHRPPQRPFFPVLPAQQNLPLLAQMADQQTATRAVATSFRSGPLLTPGSPTRSRATRPAIRSSSREELVTLRHNSSLDTTAAAGSTAFAATPSSVLALCRPPSCRHEPLPSQRVGPRRVSLELGSSSSPSNDQHAVEEDDSIVYETSSSRQTTDSASSRLKATSPPQQDLDGAGNDTDHTDKEESSSSSSTQKTISNITEVVFQDEEDEEDERLPGTLHASYCTTPPRNSNRRNKINNTTFEQQLSPSVAHILGLSPVIGVVVPPPRPAVAAAPFMMSPPPQQQVATRHHHHHHQEVVLLVTPHVHQLHNDDSSGGEDDPLLFLGVNDDPDPMRYLPEQKTIFGAGDGDPFFLLPHVPSSQHSYPYADPRSNIAGHSIQSSTNILDAAAPLREIFDLPIISMDEDDADDDYHQRLQDMHFLSSESTGDILMDDQPHQPFSSSSSVPSSFHTSTNSNTYVAMEEDLHVSSVAAQSHTAITDSQKEETTSFVVPYVPRVGTIVAI